MFICSVRASTLRLSALIVLLLAAAIGFGVVTASGATVYTAADGTEIRFDGVRENADRVAFLGKFGITVKETPSSEETFRLPEVLDRVLLSYNEIQKEQGLDISKYGNKKVTRYTYEVTNAAGGDGGITANVIVYRNRVIAADYTDGVSTKALIHFGES